MGELVGTRAPEPECQCDRQIDFARAARGPKTAGTALTFIPYARDALGILYYPRGPTHLADITTADLTTLYSSATGTATFDGHTVYACLPISSSSPVTNLESALGLTSTQIETAATAAGCNGVQQNSGNSFLTAAEALPGGSAADAVIPISSGSWIGQANGVGYDRSNLGSRRWRGPRQPHRDRRSPTRDRSERGAQHRLLLEQLVGIQRLRCAAHLQVVRLRPSVPLEDIFVGTGSAICSDGQTRTRSTLSDSTA